MFTLRPRARRLAAQWLAAWLFALASGLVNACVVVPGLHAVKVPAHEHAAACCGDEMDGSADGAWVFGPCGKFCADKSSGVPTAKAAFDFWPVLGLALAPAWDTWAGAPAPRGPQRPDGAPRRSTHLPVHIAYLRLTL